MDMEKSYRKLSRKYGFWMGLALFLLGALVGFWMAPAKKGFRINNIGHISGDKAAEETMKTLQKEAAEEEDEEMNDCEDEDEYIEEDEISF